MNTLLEALVFKFTWRDYQERFLSRFNEHIHDNHLHVVAPPGSGKTILGLEMLRRVGTKSLILTPTLTIRNQWKNRLEEFFLSHTAFHAYSTDLKNPSTLTFSTYQSMYALDKKLHQENDSLLNYLHSHGIKTLVLDEAHHLKNTWWNSLFRLKEMQGLTIISLTATPPYDSSTQELNNYFTLCGPIDDEIAVPDLVANGDLCPHQDYIYFCRPQKEQIDYIVTYRERLLTFNNSLVANTDFQNLLLSLPLYERPEECIDVIYEKPEFFSAVLIFLKAAGHTIAGKKLKFLGFDSETVLWPNLTYEWLEVLLQEILVQQRDSFLKHEPLLSNLEKELIKIGVFERKRIDFIGDHQLYRSLANSPSKLKSIASLLNAAHARMGNGLRSVVLTDFIRKEYLDFKGNDTSTLVKLGVVSIFQFLRTKVAFKAEIAVLTGSLVILHQNALRSFTGAIGTAISYTTLEQDEGYVVIDSFGKIKNKIVAVITDLFQRGVIKILIGTKSLLGEGWDAPAINTLILASYVGSFVSSNQMRGRAIRVDTNKPRKTSAIWHLACLDPTVEDGGKDLERLERRFKAFHGVSLAGKAYIENGLDRLQIPKTFAPNHDLNALNLATMQTASKQGALIERWNKAITSGSMLIREVRVLYLGKVPYRKEKKLRWGNASKYLLFEVVVAAGLFFPEFLAKHLTTIFSKGVFYTVYIFLAGLFVSSVPKTFKAIKLYFLFGDVQRKTKKMALTIMKTLSEMGLVQTPESDVSILIDEELNGTFTCYLKGATTAESGLFVTILAEMLAPIANPRYLLIRDHWLKRHFGLRNYFAVPTIFGRRKKDAELFHGYWETQLGTSKLLFTRSLAGRRELLKARLSHIIYQFKDASKKAITWK